MIRQVLVQAYVPFLQPLAYEQAQSQKILSGVTLMWKFVNGQPMLHIRLQQGKLGASQLCGSQQLLAHFGSHETDKP
jgi:hypothetical protein